MNKVAGCIRIVFVILLLQSCGLTNTDDMQQSSKESSVEISSTTLETDSLITEASSNQLDYPFNLVPVDDNQSNSSIYLDVGEGEAHIKGSYGDVLTVGYLLPLSDFDIFIYVNQKLVQKVTESEGTIDIKIPEEIINSNETSDAINVIQFSQFKDNDPETNDYISNTLVPFQIISD